MTDYVDAEIARLRGEVERELRGERRSGLTREQKTLLFIRWFCLVGAFQIFFAQAVQLVQKYL